MFLEEDFEFVWLTMFIPRCTVSKDTSAGQEHLLWLCAPCSKYPIAIELYVYQDKFNIEHRLLMNRCETPVTLNPNSNIQVTIETTVLVMCSCNTHRTIKCDQINLIFYHLYYLRVDCTNSQTQNVDHQANHVGGNGCHDNGIWYILGMSI